jgi:NADH-quinone oxidoreductase subunit J
MTVAGAAFYALAVLVLAATGVAVTRREPMHAVAWLVISVLGTALLFALLGAPLLAALEVVVYAGGILVLFLFVILMLKGEPVRHRTAGLLASARRSLPALGFAALLLLAGTLVAADLGATAGLPLLQVSPREFGAFLFSRYALAVEIASTLLFVALVGALYLGRGSRGERT